MGSPLGPFLPDIYMYMWNFEKLAEISISNSILYRRYVDDIVVITSRQLEADNTLNALNQAQNDLTLSKEIESNDSPPFLDILIKRREDGTITENPPGEDSIWTYVVTVLFNIDGALCGLHLIVSGICTSDTREKELIALTNTLVRNGYPRNLINRNKSKVIEYVDAPHIVHKKPAFINLPFKGDSYTFTIKQCLKIVIERTYRAARLFLLSKTKPIYVPNFSRINNDAVTSHCIYQFMCDCGSKYVGRQWECWKLELENIPKWLENQISSPYPIDGNEWYPASSIAKHLIGWMLLIHSKWFTRTKGGGCFNLLRHWLFGD